MCACKKLPGRLTLVNKDTLFSSHPMVIMSFTLNAGHVRVVVVVIYVVMVLIC